MMEGGGKEGGRMKEGEGQREGESKMKEGGRGEGE